MNRTIADEALFGKRMTYFYSFWLGIAVIGLLIGYLSPARKRYPRTASGRLKSMLTAIGSPMEYALVAVVVFFLWRSGAFEGTQDLWPLGFFAMLVIPIVLVLFVFVKLGGRSKVQDREDKD